jgi:hypothetical protein
MSYLQPQVQVFQEADLLPATIVDPLRACIIGGNARLFRYSDADEKLLIALGAYDYLLDTDYDYPNKPAGGIVDQDYFKLWADDVLLLYHTDAEGGGYGTVAPVAGYSNRIRSDTVAYIDNTFAGVTYPRHASLIDRDCQVGDIVDIRAVVLATTYTLRTSIAGFHGEPVVAIVDAATADANNETAQVVDCDIEQTAGSENCVTATCDATAYEGDVDGDVEETYTITVTQASVGGDFTTALLRVRSASGNDDYDDVSPSAAGVATAIGDRGLTVTFAKGSTSSCSLAATEGGVSVDDMIVGQVWTCTVSQLFTPPTVASGGTYTGETDTTYIITVSRGGEFTAVAPPQITVTTTTGVDLSGPTNVAAASVAVNVGTAGVTITFSGVGVDRLCAGDTYYIEVTAAGEGAMQTIELQNNMVAALLTAPDVELKLYIEKTGIEIPEERTGSPPDVNYDLGTAGSADTDFTVNAGITAYDSTWTASGVLQPLPIVEADLFAEYRVWVCTMGDNVYEAADEDDLDDIPGQSHPDNPLKWGVTKALLNSNGTAVKYVAVCDPNSDAAWTTALDKLDGNSSIYGIVPLTRDDTTLASFMAHVIAQSAADIARFRVLWVSLYEAATVAVANYANSEDGSVLLATVSDNPAVVGDQWTIVEIPSGNAQFVTLGVEAGDIVRYNYTTDGWGNVSYDEYVIDAVINEDTLRLVAGQGSTEQVVPKKMEVWRTRTDAELATALAAAASDYNSELVRAVWPDYFDDSTYSNQDGWYLCCILAGLRSGIAPNQGMTNLELTGVTSVPRTDEKFSRTELNEMADAGVWIVTELEDGDIITRHAITTAGFGELTTQEEMIISNVHSISFGMRNVLEPRFGVSNVVPSSLEQIRLAVEGQIAYFKEVRIARIGGQLIDGEVVEIRQHAVSKDRIVINTRLTIPAPLNNAELNQVIVI